MRRPVGVKWVLLYFRWTRFFSRRVATVATLPSALFDERFCSLGGSWVFSFQPVLPPDYRVPSAALGPFQTRVLLEQKLGTTPQAPNSQLMALSPPQRPLAHYSIPAGVFQFRNGNLTHFLLAYLLT